MAAWKLAPALACGNTAILKPAETTPLTALLLAEICQEAELPAGVVTILTGDGAAGAALVRAPGIDKIAFTGSTAVGRRSRPRSPGRGVGLTLELGGKSANIVFEDAALDQAVEGIVEGIFFNQGHVCCAGSRLLIQESVPTRSSPSCGRGWGACASATRSTRTPTSARSTRPSSSQRIEALVAAGEDEGAIRRTIACELPERGYWFAPTLFTDVAPAHRIAVEEIFGPVVSVLTLPHPGRGDREGEQLALRARRRHLDRQGREGVRGRERAAGRRRLAEHLQPVRPDGRVRRLQGVGLRPRGRAGRPAAVPEGAAMSRSGSPVRKTYKLYIGGAFVRSESGRYDRASATCQHPARLAQGRARRGRRGAQGGRAVGGADGLQPRPDPLPRRRGARVARATRLGRATDREPRSRPPSTCSCTTPAGPTSSRRCWAGSTRSPRRSCPSRCPSRPASSAWSRPTSRRCSGWSPRSRPALAAGNTVVAVLSEPAPLRRARPRRGARRLRRPRRRGQPAVGPPRRARHGARRPPRRQRDRRRGRRRRARRRARPARGRDDQARAPRAPRRRPTTRRSTTRSSASRRSPSSRPPGTRSGRSTRLRAQVPLVMVVVPALRSRLPRARCALAWRSQRSPRSASSVSQQPERRAHTRLTATRRTGFYGAGRDVVWGFRRICRVGPWISWGVVDGAEGLIAGPHNSLAGTWIAAQSGRQSAPFMQVGINEAHFALGINNGRVASRSLYSRLLQRHQAVVPPTGPAPARPGDTISAHLRLASERWHVLIVDHTHPHKVAFRTADDADTAFNQAEWLQEDPSISLKPVHALSLSPVVDREVSPPEVDSRLPRYARIRSQWTSENGDDLAPSPLSATRSASLPHNRPRLACTTSRSRWRSMSRCDPSRMISFVGTPTPRPGDRIAASYRSRGIRTDRPGSVSHTISRRRPTPVPRDGRCNQPRDHADQAHTGANAGRDPALGRRVAAGQFGNHSDLAEDPASAESPAARPTPRARHMIGTGRRRSDERLTGQRLASRPVSQRSTLAPTSASSPS